MANYNYHDICLNNCVDLLITYFVKFIIDFKKDIFIIDFLIKKSKSKLKMNSNRLYIIINQRNYKRILILLY